MGIYEDLSEQPRRTGREVEPPSETGRQGVLSSQQHCSGLDLHQLLPTLTAGAWAPGHWPSHAGRKRKQTNKSRSLSHCQLPPLIRAQLIGRISIISRYSGAKELEKCRTNFSVLQSRQTPDKGVGKLCTSQFIASVWFFMMIFQPVFCSFR